MGQTVVPVQTNGAIVLVNNGTVEHKTSKTNTDDDKTRKQVRFINIFETMCFKETTGLNSPFTYIMQTINDKI